MFGGLICVLDLLRLPCIRADVECECVDAGTTRELHVVHPVVEGVRVRVSDHEMGKHIS